MDPSVTPNGNGFTLAQCWCTALACIFPIHIWCITGQIHITSMIRHILVMVGPVDRELLNRRHNETSWCGGFLIFVEKCDENAGDSEVQLVRTCRRWKCLKGPLLAARTCFPPLRVQLSGLAHFSSETYAQERLMVETDNKTKLCARSVVGSLLKLLVPSEEWQLLFYSKWAPSHVYHLAPFSSSPWLLLCYPT